MSAFLQVKKFMQLKGQIMRDNQKKKKNHELHTNKRKERFMVESRSVQNMNCPSNLLKREVMFVYERH